MSDYPQFSPFILSPFLFPMGFPGGTVLKNLLANAGDPRDMGLIPVLERACEGGNGNPLQYSCLENSMDRKAWWATVHGIAKNQTRLSTCITHHLWLKKVPKGRSG